MSSSASIQSQFDPSWYLQAYPDVAAYGMDPLTHWRKYGAGEGRGINAAHPGTYGTDQPNTIASYSAPSAQATGSDRFDPAYYLTRNPDVAASGMDPLTHYIQNGYSEGRSINAGDPGRANIPNAGPMLNPNDPNSWAGWQMQAHAQTAGLNNLPNVSPSSAALLGMGPQAVSALYRKAVTNLGMGA